MKLMTMRKEAKEYRHTVNEKNGLLEMIDWLELEVKNLNKKTMLEVGTYLGESAALFSPHFAKVYTCDPWSLQFMQQYGSSGRVSYEHLIDKLRFNLKKTKNVHFIRQPSALAALNFPDQSLDFLYIDAWHRVIPTVVDLITWIPKVKPEGFIGGHDYRSDFYSEVIPAVRYVFGEPDFIFSDSSWLKRIPKRLNLKGMK